MADPIRCPMCSNMNPPDLELCQFCHARLHPLVAGQAPSDQPDDDQPDWLRDLRGKQDVPEQGSSSWEDSDPGEIEQGEIPDWLARIREKSQPENEDQPLPDQPEQEQPEQEQSGSGVPDWLRGSSTHQPEITENPVSAPAEIPGSPGMGFEDETTASSQAGAEKDWLEILRSRRTSDEPLSTPPAFITGAEDSLEWPGKVQPEQPTHSEPAPETPQAGEPLPDWFEELSLTTSEPPDSSAQPAPESSTPQEVEEALPTEELPEWLAQIEETAAVLPTAQEPPTVPGITAPSDAELPDWLKSSEEAAPGQSEASASEPLSASLTSDWLASLDQPLPAPSQAGHPPVEEPLAPGEEPAWLADLGPGTGSSENYDLPPLSYDEEPAAPVENQPAEPFATEDMPDWLSSLGPAAELREQAAVEEVSGIPDEPAAAGEEGLAPAELPSWVQAMRPIPSISSTPTPELPQEEDTRLEKSGPLSGLRGVLPADSSALNYRKPATYSVRLQTSEAQRRYAQFLEELLANENVPAQARPERAVSTQRLLRLVIGVLLVAAVVLGSFIPMMPVPELVPQETIQLHDAVRSLPDGAPVLLVVDYEPALAGEMESAAAPLVNHLMARGARLALVSTQPTGSALAAHLLENGVYRQPEVYHDPYITHDSLLDLGYVAGGPTGIASLLVNPSLVAPGWRGDHPVLQGVDGITGFNQVILLTDGIESGRDWFEQIKAAEGQLTGLSEIPVMLVTSAQAAPVLRAYLDSQQASGMLSGLVGGSIYEGLVQRPGTANRQWDGFQAALMVSILMILVGGLLNGSLGLFTRRNSKGEG